MSACSKHTECIDGTCDHAVCVIVRRKDEADRLRAAFKERMRRAADLYADESGEASLEDFLAFADECAGVKP